MLVLVGSRAIHHHFPWAGRVHAESDWDWLSDGELSPLIDGSRVNEIFTDERLAQWRWGQIATVNELYTLKISHAFWNIGDSWLKHAYDIMALRRQGAEFIRPLYDILRPIWKEQHGRKEVNLNQTKDRFFSDNVRRKYDHDSLHETVSYSSAPLYKSVLKEGSEVNCSYELFDALSQADKVKLIREEIYVTALERILVPSGFTKDSLFAYRWSLQRCITSLLKNEWALFMVLNLEELFTPDLDYRALHRSRAARLILLEDA